MTTLLTTLAIASSGVVALGATPAQASVSDTVVLPGVVRPLDVLTVPGDAIWIARGGTVERFIPGSDPETITMPAGTNARHLALAPDGTIWFGGLDGALGTIDAAGTVTPRALAQPTSTVNDLAVGNDGALWVLAANSVVNHVERGAPGQPMTEIPIPFNTRYDAIAPGGAGAVVVVGNDDASIAADGTITALAGIPGGTINDLEQIGDETWVTTTSGMAVINDTEAVSAFTLGQVPGGIPVSITAGPDARAWYAAGASSEGPNHLGRIGAAGPEAATRLLDDATPPYPLVAEHLAADPTGADRLWVISYSSEIVLRPVDLSRQLTSLAVDDPGPSLTFGVPTTVTARFTAFPGGSLPTNGTVTFFVVGSRVVLGTAPLQAGGTATASITPPAGSLNLVASYGGNIAHAPALSSPATFRTVANAPTTTILTPPAGTLRPGNASFKVRVTSTTGALPTGKVKIGQLQIPVSGGVDQAFTLPVAPGPISLTATFVPDPGFAASGAALGTVIARWDTDEENYVMAAYLRLFGRYPDPSGRTYWANQLRSGLSRDRFALAQVATSEYRRTIAKRVALVSPGATVAQAKPVVDTMAKTSVRNLLVEHWAAGKKVVNCRDTIPPQFAPDGSFMCWVKQIFTTFTGTATADDFVWASQYGNTPAGRTQITTILVYSDTAVRPLVESAYRSYLGRAPDPSGWTYWTKKIQGGMREEGVEARVLGSDEFFRRTLIPAS